MIVVTLINNNILLFIVGFAKNFKLIKFFCEYTKIYKGIFMEGYYGRRGSLVKFCKNR